MASDLVTVADFKSRFADIGGTDAQIAELIALASEISCVSKNAVLYLAAHLLILDRQDKDRIDGGLGEVRSEGLGPKSISWLTMSGDERDVFYGSTWYGRMFLALERRSPQRIMGAFVA